MLQTNDAAADLNALKGLRVLCLRGEGDDSGLALLLAAAQRDLGWQVETLQPELSRFCEAQSFEAAAGAVAEIDAVIRECELASGVAAGRILLAGGRDLGRGFSEPDFLSDKNAVTRAVLVDNAEPFRILRRMFAFAMEQLDEVKPDLVVFGGSAGAWTFVFRLVAKQRGIDALALRRSLLWSGRCYWTADPATLNLAARAVIADKRAAHAPVSTNAQNHIEQSRAALSEACGAADPAAPRYIYLALKEDPSEAPDRQSPFWAYQYYLVELVCSTVPAGYKLLVHEHSANAGRRPVRFRRDLSRLPNVVPIDSAEDARKYIAGAALVVTDDSPAGWQALLCGRPVITLADNFYDGAGLSLRVRDPEELAKTVVNLLAPALARDARHNSRDLGWLLDAEWETSVSVDGDAAEAFQLLDRALHGTADKLSAVSVRNAGPGINAVPSPRGDQGFARMRLEGRRVLAVLPLGNKDLGKYLTGLMAAGKERFGWTVSVLSSTSDTRPFEKLVAPKGEIFVQPPLLREADWERDPRAAHEVDRAIRTAETKTGIPLGRVILAAGHSIGRAYSAPFQFYNRYPMLLRVLRDNEEPQRIARRLFRFADDMLERNKPDVLFFFHWGTPLNLLTWLAAQRRGIPCIVLRPSKIRHDHAFLTTDPLMWNTRAAELASAKIKARVAVSDAARNKVVSFRNQPVMIGHISRKWSSRNNLGFFRWHKQYARIALNQVVSRFRGQDRSTVEGLFARLWRYYRARFITWHQQGVFTAFDPSALERMKYVYFPMHKEAELAQLLQATTWHDQRQTIRLLASALPFGYRLLVREHRMNFGRRRTHSFRELAQVPNVTLIDPFDSQFKYLQHADLVVTENGSSGWEALLLKRPTLLLAERNFYEGSGLGVTVTDPDKLHAAVIDLLSKPPAVDDGSHDQALAAMIDAEFESTFPMKPEGFGEALDAFAELLAPQRDGAHDPRTAAAGS